MCNSSGFEIGRVVCWGGMGCGFAIETSRGLSLTHVLRVVLLICSQLAGKFGLIGVRGVVFSGLFQSGDVLSNNLIGWSIAFFVPRETELCHASTTFWVA